MDYDDAHADVFDDLLWPEINLDGGIEPPPEPERPERPRGSRRAPEPSSGRGPFWGPLAIFALVNVQPLRLLWVPVSGGEAVVYLFSVGFLATIGGLLWFGQRWVAAQRYEAPSG